MAGRSLEYGVVGISPERNVLGVFEGETADVPGPKKNRRGAAARYG
jgi:hypothetical protein